MDICPVCHNPIEPDQPHIDCEIKLAFLEYEASITEGYDHEVCPCGHSHDDHYYEYGECMALGCNCPEWGEDPQNYGTLREVNLGGDPGSFKAYE